MKTLFVAALPGAALQEERIAKFAAWMGVPVELSVLDANVELSQQFPDTQPADSCLAISAETLTILHKTSPSALHLHRYLRERFFGLIVFRCIDPLQSAALACLTENGIGRIALLEAAENRATEFYFPPRGRQFSRQFAGLSFSAGSETSQAVFDLNEAGFATEAILLADGKPVLIFLNTSSCQIFLVAGSEVPEVEEQISPQNPIEDKYPQLLPFLIILRSCFPEECWHGIQCTARLIIDDPLLADRYGLLRYDSLLNSMDRARYGTSIAFIPWNEHRTSRRWVQNLLRKQANLSICVHGCDHSNREFENLDSRILMHKAGLALERMDSHEERTQMPFERVMVFPQGRFSKSAISALRQNNYIAAVNTSCFPIDSSPGDLKMGDLLRPAITGFDGFPIFQRRYPKRVIDFAFDMFLGKPAILVEHHEYFGDGCRRIEEFIAALHKIEPELRWPPLSLQLSQACMVRNRAYDLREVHFFTKKFQLKNELATKCHFSLKKHEPNRSTVESVLVDGETVPFEFKDNFIQFEVESAAGQTREIEIRDFCELRSPFREPGISYSARVFFRRELSEFRDNTLSRHPAMLKLAKKVVKRLKVTGDRKA